MHTATAATPDEARTHAVLAYIPYVLLAVAFGVTVGAGAGHPDGGRFGWVAALTAIALAYRLWWHLGNGSHRWRVAGFVLNVVLTVALISLSPLYGIYAFVGYLDAVVLFAGPAQVIALVATASLNALAQAGGPAGAVAQPAVFVLLLVVNGALAVVMVQVDRNRQRTVTGLSRALADLEEADRLNRALQDRVVAQARASGVTDERQRLSREIHDTVAQGLVALLRQIEAAGEATTLEDARRHLTRADATARDCLAEARRAVHALASPRLDQAELPHALQSLTVTWSEAAGIEVSFRVTGRARATACDADLLRICQEGLANIARHSAASQAEVGLAYTPDEVRLTLRDNGVGFDGGAVRDGHGLPGMRERMRSAGGVLTVRSAAGGGCTVLAAVPA